MAYDIFISYRRKGAGAGVAGELQAKLENRGYNVFLDVDNIGSGQFPAQIEKAIEECNDFLLVLSPGTLDRCVNEEDWVRREIIQAQNLNKNIIGVVIPGFIMPDAEALPAPLEQVPKIQVFSWMHEYRTAWLERIEENLVSSKLKKKKKRQKRLALFSFLLLVVFVGLFLLLKKTDAVPDDLGTTDIEAHSNLHIESLLFDSHVKKAEDLTRDLPDATEYKKDFLQMVSEKDLYLKLMEGLAEFDSAMLLKDQYGDAIADTYNVEAERKDLLELRRTYLDAVISDIQVMIAEDGLKFAQQDLEIAYILAFPDDIALLDSLDAVIKTRLNE